MGEDSSPIHMSSRRLNITYLGLADHTATILLARDSIYARYMPSPVRLSVCLSGRLSGRPSHGWISQRRLKLGLRNLHHSVPHDSSFLTLNFTAKFQREDTERGRQIREGYEKYAIFSK